MHTDVVIIGAGVVGCAVARQLSKRKLNCLVVEQSAEACFGTSKANSGIVHSGHQTSLDTLKGKLDFKGNALYDELHKELGFSFRRIGELVIAQAPGDEAKIKAMADVCTQKGIPYEIWDKDKIRMEEPSLSEHIEMALFTLTAGVINPYELTFALMENAMANGRKFRFCAQVSGIQKTANGLLLHITNTRTGEKSEILSRFVINAAGIHAAHIDQMINSPTFEIRPRKGQEFLLDKHITGQPKRLIFPLPTPESKGILLIPTFDHTLMIGPTAENTDNFNDLSTTPEGYAKITASVTKICPKLGPLQPIAQFAGLRAVSTTDDFIIGPSQTKGFINVAGIQSPGLTAAPAIAEYVDEILTSEGLAYIPNPTFTPISPHQPRFSLATRQVQQALVAQTASYADIICRCEVVPKAEIELALQSGAATLDGIKLRTRAGMGRCQGGFCTPRIVQMLADFLHIEVTQVEKNNPGSWIVVPHP
jgi:glycerol-3-phosphate dehydrogenase